MRRSYAIAGSPWLGASASRTERGTVVVEDQVAEVPPHLLLHLRGEPRAPVDHRQQHAGERRAAG